MDDYFSLAARRDRALRFHYGYYFMQSSNPEEAIKNGVSMLLTEKPLTREEKDGIVRLIENDPEIRKNYIVMIKQRKSELLE